jgi:nucleotide-binding universal stress UspA family protein
VTRERSDLTVRPLALSTVLAATDLRPASDVALESADRLAHAAGAMLHVVHVEDASLPRDVAGSRERVDVRIGDALRRAGIRDTTAKLHVVPGPPADSIRAVAELIGADVVVVGAHRRPERRTSSTRLGGTARAIVAGATAPCLAVADPLRLPLERVLVPIDLSDGSRGALLVALSWASALRTDAAPDRRTHLMALHVTGARPDGARPQTTVLDAELDRLRRDAGSWAGVDIEGMTIVAWPSTDEAIVRFGAERRADLVVVGTRGLPPEEATRLGSVSAAVVERSPVAVLLVPPTVWAAQGDDEAEGAAARGVGRR